MLMQATDKSVSTYTSQLFLAILAILINNQNSYASEKGKLHIHADRPGAWVYLDEQKLDIIGESSFVNLLVAQGEYTLYIEKPIKNSPFAYQIAQKVTVKADTYKRLDLSLEYGFSKAGKTRWENNRQAVIQDALKQLPMISIPGGHFNMGSQKNSDEQPQHEVNIPSFKLAKYETTFNLYDLYALDSNNHLPEDNNWGRGNHPVINVSWQEIQKFITWLNNITQPQKPYRLPSEAEWEYAARAGSNSLYWWGNQIGASQANCDGCGSLWDDKSTAPVGSFKQNPFGLMDTAGNVYEWVQDCWNNNYQEAPRDGSAWLTGYCSRRILRGGSWSYFPRYMRSADRDYNYVDYRSSNDGFRLAQDH